MKKLLACASLLLAFAGPTTAPATAHPLPVRSAAIAPEAPRLVAGPLDDLTEEALAAYLYLVNIVGIEPCDALRTVLGFPSVTAPQEYAHDRLRERGYDFPTPDPAATLPCPQ